MALAGGISVPGGTCSCNVTDLHCLDRKNSQK